MTFSLVACDLERREWCVAAASKFLAIGALTTWAAPEAGAVATQSFIKASYGELRARLERLGHSTGDLARDLDAWAGIENLEDRVDGAEAIDPVVLDELRKRDEQREG